MEVLTGEKYKITEGLDMTIQVEDMKPFYVKHDGENLRIIFAYQHLTIRKDGNLYHFLPIEDKQFIYNLERECVTNVNDVFVFQCEKKYLRVSVFDLIRKEGVYDLINDLAANSKPEDEVLVSKTPSRETLAIIAELENENLLRAIDTALDEKNEKVFLYLTSQLKSNIMK